MLPAGIDAVVRPLIPVVRLSGSATGDVLRGEVAARVAIMHLDLWAPPMTGWPTWFRLGVAGVARAKGVGDGPSPRGMAEIRMRAGTSALLALLEAHDGAKIDAALATAVCAPLVSVRHHARLPALLAALRQGRPAAQAVELVYGWTLNQWTIMR